MKKISVLLVTLLFCAILCVTVFAAGDRLDSVSLAGSVPVAGQSAGQMNLNEVAVYATVSGFSRRLSDMNGDYETAKVWEKKNAESGAWEEMAPTDVFVAGSSYRQTVKITVKRQGVTVSAPVTAQFHLKAATPAIEGNVLTLSYEYTAAPAIEEPKAEWENKETTVTKTYDGKEVELSVKKEKKEGVRYRYEWYRGGAKIEGATDPFLKLRHVKESGKYTCCVYAAPADSVDPAQEMKKMTATECSVTIRRIEVVVTMNDMKKDLFDPDPKFTYTFSTEVFDTLEGEGEREAGEDVGEYEITSGTLAFAAEVADNYEVSYSPGMLSIRSIGDLPFAILNRVADDSRIVGQDDATIRIIATKGAVGEGEVLALSMPTADMRSDMRTKGRRELLSCFVVTLQDRDGYEIAPPSHATFRFQIPLTREAAEGQVLSTIRAMFRDGNYFCDLKPVIHEIAGVKYVQVDCTATGTIALYVGDPVNGGELPSDEPADGPAEPITDDEKSKDSTILWIMIGVFVFAALGIVIFTVIWAKKHPGTSEEESDAVSLERDELEEIFRVDEKTRKKNRKVAEKLNELPPIPEQKGSKEGEKEKPAQATRVISFEDLED